MLQQILAIIIIAFFLIRLFRQKKKNQITPNEFSIWLIFWLIALIAIIFLKKIDALVARLGFSGDGINVLVYLVVLALIYLVFRMRLAIAKMEKNISELNQALTLKK
jgi:hypothetical protein